MKLTKNIAIVIFSVLLLASCAGRSSVSDEFEIGPCTAIDALHAPWDALDDNTKVRLFSDEDNLYFYYEVCDSTIALKEPFTCESDVEPEDRVEIFFSATPSMEIYYCAEIDPLGRPLDYSCEYYRKMDYGWNFSTMDLYGTLTQNGYIVAGKVSKAELRELGINPEDLWMGIFRADFRTDGSVNWYSFVPTADASPDFHKPDVLFHASIH